MEPTGEDKNWNKSEKQNCKSKLRIKSKEKIEIEIWNWIDEWIVDFNKSKLLPWYMTKV